MGCKDIGIRISELVTKTQFLKAVKSIILMRFRTEQDTSIWLQFTNKFFIIFISILKFHELLFHYFASARERNTAIGGILTQFDQFGTKTLLGNIFKGIVQIIYSRFDIRKVRKKDV